jgi:hypothetical protein
MTAPPLPESPCVRVKLDYTNEDGSLAGSRFYLSYAGSAPTSGNATTLAADVSAAWGTNLYGVIQDQWSLTEVDVLDIATNTGLSGYWSGSIAGGEGSTYLPASIATNVEYDIARRYRGGKPRMFLPPGAYANLADAGHWNGAFIAAVNTAVSGFFTELEALSIGAVGALEHVNLSYYEGFKNITNSSGRERAVPTYRPAAVLDRVTGYACKGRVGSQKRRRTATAY